MTEGNPFTFREAVLTSLLVHALLFIYVLLFPETFSAKARPFPFSPDDANAPIPATFIQEPPARPPEVALGDAGKERRSDPRPPDAAAPQNDDPYSQGNTRNRFLAPPVPEKVPPAPEPGAAAGGQPDAGTEIAQAQPRPDRGGESPEETSESVPGGGFATGPQLPPSGRQGGAPKRPRGTLRDAIGKLGSGLTGGPPLKYDNPVGGLSGPSGGLSFDTPGFDWGPYARRIYWIIWNNWMRGWPPAAYAGLKGMVTVRFRIHRDGTLSGITVMEPSGTEAFDICATLALEASNPLPELPADFPNDSEGITAHFLYNIEAP